MQGDSFTKFSKPTPNSVSSSPLRVVSGGNL